MSLDKTGAQNPDPPIKAKDAARFIVDLYSKANQEISYDSAFRFASSPDFRSGLPMVYEHLYGSDKVPAKEELDSIYNGFFDKPYVEKKNQIQNATNALESASILEEKVISSDYQPQGDNPLLRSEDEFYSLLESINQEFFSQEPSKAKIQLEESMSKYGFSFELGNFGSGSTKARDLIITSPTGTKQNFRFFTPEYMASLPNQEQAEQLASVRLDRMKEFIKSNGSQAADFLKNKLAVSDETNFKSLLTAIFKDSDQRLGSEVNGIIDQMPYKTKVGDLTDFNFAIDRKKVIGALRTIKKDLPNRTYKSKIDPYSAWSKFTGSDRIEKDYKYDPKIIDGVDDMISRINRQVYATSYNVGNLLSDSGAYDKIDLNNMEDLTFYNSIGLMPEDIPLDAIKINGKARSLNYLTNIVYDFDKVQAIRDGEIVIELSDPSTAGLLSDVVVKARELVDTQEAYRSKFVGVQGMRQLEETAEIIENFGQTVALGLYEIPVSLGYIYYDSLIGMGVDEEAADMIVYGQTRLINFKGFRPEYLDKMNDKYIPKWKGDYTDLSSVHELIARGSVDMGRSLTTTATYLYNPALGLATTGVNSYAGDRRNFVKTQEELQKLKDSGVLLTSEEENILNTSAAKSRLISLGKASAEVGITSLFTYRYFKDVIKYRSLSPVIGESRSAIRDFANTYARTNRTTLLGQMSQNFGVSIRALRSEIPEEEFIAFTNYLADVAFKYDDWSWEKAKKLAANTGVSAAFTSYGMGLATNASTNRRTREIGKSLIRSNITFGSELDLLIQKQNIDAHKAELEKRIAEEKTGDPSNDPTYQFLEEQSRLLDDKINRLDKEKERITKQMSTGDRVSFIDLMAKIKRSKDVFDKTNNPNAQKDIEKYKEEARKILSKYPSKIGFHFSDQSIQDLIRQKAFTDLKEEYSSKGASFELSDQDTEVTERAEEMYERLVLIGSNSKNKERKEIHPFFKEVFGDNELVFKDGRLTDLANNVFIENNVDSSSIPFQLYGYINSDGMQTNPNSTLEDLETTLNFLKQQRSPEDQDVVESPSPELMSSQLIPAARVDKALEIVGRLKDVDLNSFADNLTDRERDILQEFEFAIKNNEDVNFTDIENLTTAFEVISQIRAKVPEAIKLEGVTDPSAPITSQAFNVANELAQKLAFTRLIGTEQGLATKDMIAKILFKDSEVGKPFLDLFQEALRSSAEGANTADDITREHEKAYDKDTFLLTNKNSVENSYEMYILSALRREVADDQESDISEFDRMKRLILQERELRQQDVVEDPTPENKKRLKAWDKAIKNLGIENATSYDDVVSKAKKYNVNAIERLASVMPGSRAIQHIKETTGRDPFKFKDGTYTPLFMRKGNNGFTELYNRKESDNEIDQFIPESFRANTRPTNLSDGVRLNPEGFWMNAYGSLRSMEMDIAARKNYDALDLVVNSKSFLNLFEQSETRKNAVKELQKIPKNFNSEVGRSRASVVVDGGGSTLNNAISAAYSTASTVALGRVSQRASQYYSAFIGISPLIKNDRAKLYAGAKVRQFTTGTAGITAKTTSNSELMNMIRESFGNAGLLDNLYRKSRTGLRNSAIADIAIDRGKYMPVSYYTTLFNMGDTEAGLIRSAIGTGKYTIDGFFNIMSKSSENVLNMFLASADRMAASHAFETLYMDHRISQGAKVPPANKPGELKKWWAEENKNPNLEAIRYADDIVIGRMRGSQTAAEASVYNSNKHKNLMRVLFPFGRFQINAKSDISLQLSILNDPSIPQDQKDDARRVLQGRIGEVLSYNAIKYSTSLASLTGIAATYFTLTGGEEEDIDRMGGMTELIGTDILPIESREYIEAFDQSLSSAKTLEEKKAIEKYNFGLREVESIAKDFHTYAMAYENKFKVSQDYSVFGSTVQDLLMTNNPFPTPEVIEDFISILVNEAYGEDIAMEFISRDIDRADTTDGKLLAFAKNAGMASLGLDQIKAFERAYNIAFNFEIRKFAGELKPDSVKEYIYAPNDIMREKVVGATQLLFALRLHSLINPLAPRADLDRLADKLDRSIETYFTRSTVDDRMFKMENEMVIPLLSKGFGITKPFKEPEAEPEAPKKKEKEKEFEDTGGFGF